MADTLTPEEKKRLTQELTNYANEGASDDDLRQFRDAFISELKKKGGTSQGQGQPAQQPTKPSTPSFGKKVVTDTLVSGEPVMKGVKKEPQKKEQDITFRRQELPSETTQAQIPQMAKTIKSVEEKAQEGKFVQSPVTKISEEKGTDWTSDETIKKVNQKAFEKSQQVLQEKGVNLLSKEDVDDQIKKEYEAQFGEEIDSYMDNAGNKSDKFFPYFTVAPADLSDLQIALGQREVPNGTTIEKEGKRGEITSALMDDYFTYMKAKYPEAGEAEQNKYQVLKSRADRSAKNEEWLHSMETRAIQMKMSAVKRNYEKQKSAVNEYSQIESSIDTRMFDSGMIALNKEKAAIDEEYKRLNEKALKTSQAPDFTELEARSNKLQQDYETLKVKSRMTDENVAKLEQAKGAYRQLGQSALSLKALGTMNQDNINYYSEYSTLKDQIEKAQEAGKQRWESASPLMKMIYAPGELANTFASGIGDLALNVVQIPKVVEDLVTGNTEYNFLDEFYDGVENYRMEKRLDFPSIDSESTTQYLAGLGGNTLSSLAVFALGGSFGGASKMSQFGATFVSSMLTTEVGAYEEAINTHKMSPRQAAASSTAVAVATSLMEGLIPDIKYFEPSAFRKSMLNEIASGKNVSQALRSALPESAESYLLSGLKEGGEELAQQTADDGVKKLINYIGETEYFKDLLNGRAYQDAALGGLIGGGAGNFFKRPVGASNMSEEVMLEAAENADGIIAAYNNNENIAKVERDLKGPRQDFMNLSAHPNWKNLDRPKKARAFGITQQIRTLEETNLKDPIINAQIERLKNERQEILSIGENGISAKSVGTSTTPQRVKVGGEYASFFINEDGDYEIEYNNGRSVIVEKGEGVADKIREMGIETDEGIVGDMNIENQNTLITPALEKGATINYAGKNATLNNYAEKKGKIVSVNITTEDGKTLQIREGQQGNSKQLLENLNALKYDQENQIRISSEVGVGQESVTAQPIEVTSEEAPPTGGVLQEQEEVTPTTGTAPVSDTETNAQKVERLRAKEQAELTESIPNIESYKVDGKIDKSLMTPEDLAKYNEIYDRYDKLITPLLPTTGAATTEAPVVKPSRRERLAKMFETSDGEIAAEKVASFLGEANIGVEVLDPKSFEEKGKQRNFEGSADGIFLVDNNTGKIYLNKERIKGAEGKTIAFHEGIHPVVNIIRNTNPKLYSAIVDGLKAEAVKNAGVAEAAEAVASSEYYQEQGPSAIEDETVVETMARVAAGDIDIDTFDPSFREKFVEFMNKLAKMLGLKAIAVNSPRMEVKRLADQLSKALNEGGKLSDVVGKENVGKFQNTVGAQKRAVSVAKGKESLVKYGLKKGVNTTRKIGEALEKRSRELYGIISREDRSEKALKAISSFMADEVRFFVEEFGENSGKGWYGEKFQKGLDAMAAVFPEMKDDQNARDLFTMLVAITSDGTEVMQNFQQASLAYKNYKETGKMPTAAKAQRAESYLVNFNNIQTLLDKYNGDIQAIKKELLTIGSISELNQQRKAQGLEKLDTKWPASFKVPLAASIFGPKLGMFYANLSGMEQYPTLDRWWSRTFNRYRGTLIPQITRGYNKKGEALGIDRYREIAGLKDASEEEVLAKIVQDHDTYEDKGYKKGTPAEKAANTLYKKLYVELNDVPFGAKDRQFMYDAFIETQKKLKRSGINVTIADIQAILWYFEKNLYKKLGVTKPIQGISYEDAANKTYEKWKNSGGSFNYTIKDSEQGETIDEVDIDEETAPTVQPSKGIKRGSNLVKETYYESGLTEDKNDYVFFHVSSAPEASIRKGIDSTKYTSLRTSRDEKGLQYGVASYYTRPEDGERMVGGEKYAVRVPKGKVYPIDSDPLGYGEKAEAKIPEGTPFRGEAVKREVAEMAKKNGYEMIVGEWSYSRTGKPAGELPEFRADALVPLKPTKEKPDSFTSNAEKGMERIPFPSQQSEQAKQELESIASEVRDIMSSKKKFSSKEYQLADSVYMNGQVTENKYEDNEFKRDITPEEYDMMTKVLPKSMQADAARVRGLLFGKKGQASIRIPRNVKQFSDNVSETVDRIKTATSEDGATLNLDGSTYEDGGLVVPAGSINVAQDDVSAEGLFEFLKDNEGNISSDIFKIGLYKFPDRPEVSYDLNIVIPREYRDVALKFGELTGQESLFDLDTYENIKTGSDGKNPRKFTAQELAEIAKDLSEGKLPKIVSEEKIIDSRTKELQEEAKKYRTANAFIKAQGKPVYHGSKAAKIIEKEGFKLLPYELRNMASAFGEGVYFATKKSGAYTSTEDGMVEAYLPPNIKLKQVYDQDAFRVNEKKLIEEGYAGVELQTWGSSKNLTIFDPSIVKTKTQLIDIWNSVSEKTKQGQPSMVKRTPAQTQKLIEDALDAVEGAIADGVDADAAVTDSVTSQDWYGQLTPRQKEQLDEIINDEFGVTPKAPVVKPTGIKATITNIIDNYYKGDRQSKLDNKQILESDPKLKYIYDNISSINKQLQSAGVITDKTDGCP